MTGKRIGVAGVGLIGGSIALRARAAGAWVGGYDVDASVLAAAHARGALDAAFASLEALAGACDVLVVALPVDVTADALARIAAAIRRPALILDVASVKAPFAGFSATLPAYVGTHPMAGRERGGIAAADAALFEGATWAHLPHADPAAIAGVRAFIAEMGARPLEVDAARHDAIVALTSHLPQALSVALATAVAQAGAGDADVMELCGPGMMSMVRLARSPASIWAPIVAANAAPLAARLRSLAAMLVAAAEGLDRGDSQPLMSYFESARIVTDAFEKRSDRNSRS